MSTTSYKTMQRALLASPLLVAVAACSSNVAPDPQLAAAAIATENTGG